MEREALKAEQGLAAGAVEHVGDNRMLYCRAMHAYLMGAARFWKCLYICGTARACIEFG